MIRLKHFQLLIIFSAFLMLRSAYSQQLSHFTAQYGLSFYWFNADNPDVYGSVQGGMKIGIGADFILGSKSASRFQYHLFYLQEKFGLNYLDGFYDYGEKRDYLNHVLQNQFLWIGTNYKNTFNFRIGLLWDIILNRQHRNGSMPSGYIHTDAEDQFKYQSLGLQVGIGFNIKQRVSLCLDYQRGLTPWYVTGKARKGTVTIDNDFVYKRMWSVTLGYLIYSKKRNSDIKGN